MKIRIGFVSNSSSASFVIYGVKFQKVDLDLAKNILQKMSCLIPETEDGIWDAFYNINRDNVAVLSDDGAFYIGFIVANISSDGGEMEEQEISLEELTKSHEILERFENMPIKLYTGTRSC